MGLDMYAYSIEKAKVKEEAQQVGFCGEPSEILKDVKMTEGFFGGEVVDTSELDQFHYWRKHHNLHGLMHAIAEEYGFDGEFNCDYLLLTEKDLDRIEMEIKQESLPSTSGFFFGNFPPDEQSKKDDLAFVEAARQAIAEGNVVYYSSWW